MERYEVTLQAAVIPRQGELIIPFRETVIRKLERKGKERDRREIVCRRVKRYITTHLKDVVFFALLGPMDREKGTLPIDALITFAFILLELKEPDLFRRSAFPELIIDQSFLQVATTSTIRLDQFEEFREFILEKVEEERVPAGIRSRYAFLKSPLYYRLR